MCLVPKAGEDEKAPGFCSVLSECFGEMEEATAVLPEHWGTPAVLVECLETLGKQRNADGCCVTRHSSV